MGVVRIRNRITEKTAVQFVGNNNKEIEEFVGDALTYAARSIDGETSSPTLQIRTLEGDMFVSKGDWVIKGVQGEFYPCKPDIFEKSYEVVDGGTD